jgi:antitoxin component YwqK of YwqJK toxin-antitoxin module
MQYQALLMDERRLEEIKTIYSNYIEDPEYVYKICMKQYIVIMKKLPTTQTNEKRDKVGDPGYAKFRADCLEVCVIININEPMQKLEYVISNYGNRKIKYEINNSVVPDEYDINQNNVCTGGIHYFNSIDRAFFYRNRPSGYDGTWIEWHDNGHKYSQGNYHDNKKTGIWIEWYNDGHIYSQGNYCHDKKTGPWFIWHANGKKQARGVYCDGKKIGHWVTWDDNGNKETDSFYLRDNKIDNWLVWYCYEKMMHGYEKILYGYGKVMYGHLVNNAIPITIVMFVCSYVMCFF